MNLNSLLMGADDRAKKPETGGMSAIKKPTMNSLLSFDKIGKKEDSNISNKNGAK